METGPSSVLNNAIIGHQLFGSDEENDVLTKRLNTIGILRELKQQPAQFWANLASKYFTDKYVHVVGLPDADLVAKVAAEV